LFAPFLKCCLRREKNCFFSSREYTWRVDYFGSDLSHLFPRFPIISNPDPIFSFYWHNPPFL
jgi:hypothetical protein